MRNQAVSTRDMRSGASNILFLPEPASGDNGARCWVTSLPSTQIFTHEGSAMADIPSAFEAAVVASKQLPEKPDNMTLLKLYALYKQATEGDAQGKRPGFTDLVGRAKFDAWAAVKGQNADEAMQEYIDLIDSLK
jgi:acyl-CoA-binding protein